MALLGAPTNLTAVYNENSSISVTWEAVAAATSYFVYHSLKPTGPFVFKAVAASAGYADTTYTPEVFNYYKITAIGGGFQSVQSEEVYTIAKVVDDEREDFDHYDLLYHSTQKLKLTRPHPFYGENKFYAKYIEEIFDFLLGESASYYDGIYDRPKFWVYCDCDDPNVNETLLGTGRLYNPVDDNYIETAGLSVYRRDYEVVGTIENFDAKFFTLYLKQIKKFLEGCFFHKFGSLASNVEPTLIDYKSVRDWYNRVQSSPSLYLDHLKIVNKDCNVSDWSLNNVRPTYPAAVVTKDHNILFIDLLRAKADKFLTSEATFGKYSILSIDPFAEPFTIGNFNFLPNMSSVSVFVFYNAADFIICNKNLHPILQGTTNVSIKEVTSVSSTAMTFIDTDNKSRSYTFSTEVTSSPSSDPESLIRITQNTVHTDTYPYIARNRPLKAQKILADNSIYHRVVGNYPGNGTRKLYYNGNVAFILDDSGKLWGAKLWTNNGLLTRSGDSAYYPGIYPLRDAYLPGNWEWDMSFSRGIWITSPIFHNTGQGSKTNLVVGGGTGTVNSAFGCVYMGYDGTTDIFPLQINYTIPEKINAERWIFDNDIFEELEALTIVLIIGSYYYTGGGGGIDYKINGTTLYSKEFGDVQTAINPPPEPNGRVIGFSCGPPEVYTYSLNPPVYTSATGPGPGAAGVENIDNSRLVTSIDPTGGVDFTPPLNVAPHSPAPRLTNLPWTLSAFESPRIIPYSTFDHKFICDFSRYSEVSASDINLDFTPEPFVKVTPKFDELSLVRFYPLAVHGIKTPNNYYHEAQLIMGEPNPITGPTTNTFKKKFTAPGFFTGRRNYLVDPIWTLQDAPVDATVEQSIRSNRVCEVTMPNSHSIFSIICEDDWEVYECPFDEMTTKRKIKTKAQVWSRTLPVRKRTMNGTSITSYDTNSFLEFSIIGMNYLKYTPYIKISDRSILAIQGKELTALINNDVFNAIAVDYNKFLLKMYGITQGSAEITFIERVYSGSTLTAQGKSTTFTVHVWDVNGLPSDTNSVMSIDEVRSLNIVGETSYPHKWSTSDADVAQVTQDPEDSRLATLTAYSAGTFFLTVTDSAGIPFFSRAITVS